MGYSNTILPFQNALHRRRSSQSSVDQSPSPRSQSTLACFSYATCSTLLTLANKAIFSEHKLNYPWMLLGVQSIVVTQILLTFYTATQAPPILNKKLFGQMLFPCLFFTSFIFTNARALRYISLPVLTVLKSLAPMGVAIAEWVVFQERIGAGAGAAMVLIVVGNIVTVQADVEFNLAGYIWAGINVLMNVMYVVSLRYCLGPEFTSGQKTLHSNMLACIMIFPLAFLAGEPRGFLIEFGQTSIRFRLLFLLSCVLAAGIGASVFWVMKTSSGSTLSFVGAANKVVVVILGAILFDAKISNAGWVGVAVGTLAGGVFAATKRAGKNKEQGSKTDSKAVE